MCGIVGYIGNQNAGQVVLRGLSKLEYRGYDSAGAAIVGKTSEGKTKTDIFRAEGKLTNLRSILEQQQPLGHCGIGHTRWATHGNPTEANAHPHQYKNVSIVHNGIIENHALLKKELMSRGHTFSSETDSEVIAHLIVEALTTQNDNSPITAIQSTLKQLSGAYALGILIDEFPKKIFAARHDAPLIVGVGDDGKENFLASDVPAVLSETRKVIYLNNGDVAEIGASSISVVDSNNTQVEHTIHHITWDPVSAEKGGYRHFMLKEIHEQPDAISNTIRDRISQETFDTYIDGYEYDPKRTKRIVIAACGTSFHSGIVMKYLIEQYARVPVEVDLASEFRYRNPIVQEGTLFIAISQSGETADTLAAIREANKRGADTLAIVNVVGSSISREANATLHTHAGPEIGVASTKAFTTQLAVGILLTIHIGRRTKEMDDASAALLLDNLRQLPQVLRSLIDSCDVTPIAEHYMHNADFLFLARGIHVPIALEGALKLKEISYIHAEGYAAGELKHGPIALISQGSPVVAIALQDRHYEKVLSNIMEVKSRGASIVCISNVADNADLFDYKIDIPTLHPAIMPILATIPMQLIAYHTADMLGTDVDQPRNLAKSVTVE